VFFKRSWLRQIVSFYNIYAKKVTRVVCGVVIYHFLTTHRQRLFSNKEHKKCQKVVVNRGNGGLLPQKLQKFLKSNGAVA
jgi:hypothetical protein